MRSRPVWKSLWYSHLPEAVRGDVGLTAKTQRMSDSLKKCNGRQFMYYSPMLVVASGDVWVDHAVPDLSEALSVETRVLSLEDS